MGFEFFCDWKKDQRRVKGSPQGRHLRKGPFSKPCSRGASHCQMVGSTRDVVGGLSNGLLQDALQLQLSNQLPLDPLCNASASLNRPVLRMFSSSEVKVEKYVPTTLKPLAFEGLESGVLSGPPMDLLKPSPWMAHLWLVGLLLDQMLQWADLLVWVGRIALA